MNLQSGVMPVRLSRSLHCPRPTCVTSASVSWVAGEAFTERPQRNPAAPGSKALGSSEHGERRSRVPQRGRLDYAEGVADGQFVHENQKGSPHTEKYQNEGRPRGLIENNRGKVLQNATGR